MRTGEFSYKGDVEQIGGNVRRIGIVVAIIIFLALVNFTVKYYSVKKQVDKLRDDVVTLVRQAMPDTPKRALSSPKAALSLIKSKESDILERMDQLNQMVGVSPLDILNDVSEAVPERDKFTIEVNDISIADGRITLSGIVDDFKAVDTVKQAFEDAKEFKNVSTGNVSKGVKGEVKFKLSMELIGEGDEEGEEG